jgi:AmmeMemoRadiSam system protein B
MLMNKKSDFFPALRRDIQWLPIKHDGNPWLAVYDSMGYCTPNLAFPAEIKNVLSLFNGSTRRNQLKSLGFSETGIAELKAIEQLLDEHGLLYSDTFTKRKLEIDENFTRSAIRMPVSAGSCYPESTEKRRALFDKIMAQTQIQIQSEKPIALFAPHIDFKVNLELYAKAFKSIQNLKPRHVYIIGTSHYSGMWQDYDSKPFQFSEKSYQLPGRLLKNNLEKTEFLYKKLESSGSTLHDISHRIEHSIELHAVWASHIWQHEFTITPILIGSFEDTLYLPSSTLEKWAEAFSHALQQVLTEDDFVFISGDLSHIGLKFGDKESASVLKNETTLFDREFLTLAANVNPIALYELQRKTLDKYKVCGYPPLQAVLSGKPRWRGHQIGYNYWDEKITQSAVSFGAILYTKA